MRISDWSSDVCSSDLGQKPIITEAKKAIAGFKLRKGDKIGAKVTLRGERMWDFTDKLFYAVLRRTLDLDRKSVVEGKSVSVRVDLGGLCNIKNNTKYQPSVCDRTE